MYAFINTRDNYNNMLTFVPWHCLLSEGTVRRLYQLIVNLNNNMIKLQRQKSGKLVFPWTISSLVDTKISFHFIKKVGNCHDVYRRLLKCIRFKDVVLQYVVQLAHLNIHQCRTQSVNVVTIITLYGRYHEGVCFLCLLFRGRKQQMFCEEG